MISDEDFVGTIIQASDIYGEKYLADELLVSLPTIKRWKVGENLPANAVRKSVTEWLTKRGLYS